MTRSGTWCDVYRLPDGRAGWARVDNQRVIFGEPTDAPELGITAGVDMLYLRADCDGGGRLCAIGVHRADNHAYAVTSSGSVKNLGACTTPFGVEITGLGDGWVAFVQDTAGSYQRIVLGPTGAIVGRETRSMTATSQGFLDVVNGEPVTKDASEVTPSPLIVYGSERDGLIVGQLKANGIALYDRRTGQVTTLFRDLAPTLPHIAQAADGTFYVCCWRADGSWVERVARPLIADSAEDPMQKPGVTIDHFDPVIRPGQPFRVRWHDRNNPGFSGEVEIVNGSVHVRMTNPVDTDRSGNRRPVEVRCS